MQSVAISARSATEPNVNDAMTPGLPEAGEASRVTSETVPGSALCPLKPSARQNGSSYTASVFDSGPATALEYRALRSSGRAGSKAMASSPAPMTA